MNEQEQTATPVQLENVLRIPDNAEGVKREGIPLGTDEDGNVLGIFVWMKP
jgi:hypothetical protein